MQFANMANMVADISIGIDDLKLPPVTNCAVTEFSQTFTSPNYQDISTKRLVGVREGNRWKVRREQTLGDPQQV